MVTAGQSADLKNNDLCIHNRRYSRLLVRLDSGFGVLRDVDKRTKRLGEVLEGTLRASRGPSGFIALSKQQVLPNGFASLERTEAAMTAEGSHCCPEKPGTVGFRELVGGIFQALGLPPSRALSY